MATLTMQCLADMRNDTSATKQQLLDIMMAQDFQDLTGQVIRKVTELAHGTRAAACPAADRLFAEPR